MLFHFTAICSCVLLCLPYHCSDTLNSMSNEGFPSNLAKEKCGDAPYFPVAAMTLHPVLSKRMVTLENQVCDREK